jgi:hypothetical protein
MEFQGMVSAISRKEKVKSQVRTMIVKAGNFVFSRKIAG